MSIRPEKMVPEIPGLAEKVWQEVYAAAQQASESEPRLAGMLDDVILSRTSLSNAVAVRLARKLSRRDMERDNLEPLIRTLLKQNPVVVECMAADLQAVVERDAACHNALEPLLFFKGFHALATYRVAHLLWEQGRYMLALLFQSISSEVFGVDIHPAMVWVTQVEVAGELIDVKMDVDASAGKMNNANRSDYWCQVNGGTKFTVPSYPGAVISMEAYSVVSTTTIGGEAIGGESKTPEYTYDGNESEVEIVINDGSYFRYIQVVLPARELVVTDGVDLDASGTYTSASYVRLFNTAYTYGTICLPFAPDAATCANYTFYKLAEVNSEALIFEEEAAPKANTAYLYKLNDGVDAETAKTFTGGVTTISDVEVESVGGWNFIGSFAKTEITDLTGGDYWAYQAEYNGKKDVLVKAGTKLVAHPYRAYFKFVPTEELNFTPAAATMRMIIGGKEGGAMEIQEVIAPEQVEGAAFDLEGRPVQEMQKGQIYIIGGKKVKK